MRYWNNFIVFCSIKMDIKLLPAEHCTGTGQSRRVQPVHVKVTVSRINYGVEVFISKGVGVKHSTWKSITLLFCYMLQNCLIHPRVVQRIPLSWCCVSLGFCLLPRSSSGICITQRFFLAQIQVESYIIEHEIASFLIFCFCWKL